MGNKLGMCFPIGLKINVNFNVFFNPWSGEIFFVRIIPVLVVPHFCKCKLRWLSKVNVIFKTITRYMHDY